MLLKSVLMKTSFLSGGLLCLLASQFASAQPRQRNRTGAPEAQAASAPAAQFPAPPLEEKTSVTHHSARIGGQQINYTATAGTYIIRSDDGAPKAQIFYVSYTKDDVSDVSRRPISFVYNGGP